jgi:pyruvate,water dikinase
MDTELPKVLGLDDARAVRLELCGGKGANLARLTQRGFPVPGGFVVLASAYRDFVADQPGLPEAVNRLPWGNPAAMRNASLELRKTLGRLTLPRRVVAEVRAQLGHYGEDQAFSVRSSSTLEDLASAAFAGQHETYLNITGADAILARIRDCYLSLWGDRALAYRQQKGFDHQAAAMAVVVQRMIPCDVAGVAFSIDPVSGCLDHGVVDANYGLGESVVSGEAAVDHWVFDKATRSIREARIARKSRSIITTAGGTREVERLDASADEPCLGADRLGRLVDLLLRVEMAYGFPQDIEWGFAGELLHLLQSRPITTIPARWTRDESAERFPNVITPLTWDFVESGFHRSLNHSFGLMGFPAFSGRWFGMHGHYIYGNQNAVELYARRMPLTFRSLEEVRSAIPRLREQFRWVQELPVHWARDLDYYLIRLGEFRATPLERMTVKELWSEVTAINEQGAAYFLPNIAISITHGLLCRLLHQLVGLVAGPERSAGMFDRLLGYCETKTGMINKELFELAQLMRRSPDLVQLVRTSNSRELLDTDGLAAFPDFRDRFARFLRDHGHREVDFDAYAPTWIECPWVVLDNLRLIVEGPPDRSPAEKERELKIRMQQAEHELFGPLPEDLRFFFHEILRLARLYTSLDDLEHYQTTRLTPILRRALRALGQRLVEQGRIAEPMDVFFSRMSQMQIATDGDDDDGWAEWAGHARQQKAAYLADRARTPEWVLGEADQEVLPTGPALTGLPGSPGTAEGPVFQVLSPDDFARFPKGAVLVARTTNPTWTPLFYSAAAVITESGGPLSHGAVTAREMGIPAVMSVRECLSRLENGRRVRVDGARGRVELLG